MMLQNGDINKLLRLFQFVTFAYEQINAFEAMSARLRIRNGDFKEKSM
jgi:hypothetical protein